MTDDEAKRFEIGLMERRLRELNVIIEFSYFEYRDSWHVVLLGNYAHVGGVDTTHSYLSGAYAVANAYEGP